MWSLEALCYVRFGPLMIVKRMMACSDRGASNSVSMGSKLPFAAISINDCNWHHDLRLFEWTVQKDLFETEFTLKHSPP